MTSLTMLLCAFGVIHGGAGMLRPVHEGLTTQNADKNLIQALVTGTKLAMNNPNNDDLKKQVQTQIDSIFLRVKVLVDQIFEKRFFEEDFPKLQKSIPEINKSMKNMSEQMDTLNSNMGAFVGPLGKMSENLQKLTSHVAWIIFVLSFGALIGLGLFILAMTYHGYQHCFNKKTNAIKKLMERYETGKLQEENGNAFETIETLLKDIESGTISSTS